MAAPLGGTVGVIGQLNDPQYLNWIKATRAMHITMEALRTFCRARMNGLHQLLLLKHGATQCSGPCSCGNIRYIRNTNNYVINCPNNVCSQWLADIVAERATPTTRLKFANCDISQWPVQPWQIAKVFMDRQDPSTVSPNDTDASGILQLLKNCKYFTPFLDTRKADAVRQVRNCLMHTSTMKVTTADLSTYMTTMNDLLQDNRFLLNDPVAQHATQEIQQIQTTPIDVRDAAFMAHECQAWRQALSAADVRHRQDILNLIAPGSALDVRLQAEIAAVKQTLEGDLQMTNRTVEAVKGDLQMTNRTVEAVKAVQQQHGQDIEQLHEDRQRHGQDIAQQQSSLQHLLEEQNRLQQVQGQDNKDQLQQVVSQLEVHGQQMASQLEIHEQQVASQLEVHEQQVASQLEVHEQQLKEVRTTHEKAKETKMTDGLKELEERLRKAQQGTVEDYLSKKKEEDDNDTVKNLSEIYVDLRIHDSKDAYKRLETRTHHEVLKLQKDYNSCRPIDIKDLFLPERGQTYAPRRILVDGKAGIGKTMLTMHILDMWVNGQLPFRYVFYFALRDLPKFRGDPLTITELFSEYHEGGSTAEFDKLITEHPEESLLVLDGADEVRGEMPEPVASILQGKTLKKASVLVTTRPGGITDYKFDKTAEIYGLTQEKIDEFTSKFCGDGKQLKTRIDDYIKTNSNIAALCYVPFQCRLVCRIVKDSKDSKEKLPATITQLYILALTHLGAKLYTPNKECDTVDEDDVFGKLNEHLLNHAKLARLGMGKSPVKVTFSKHEIDALHLKEAATECGLLTLSKEKNKVQGTHRCTYAFTHLTVQEFLSALALVNNRKDVELLMKKSRNDGQLDLMWMFLCGLIGDHKNKTFLDSLDCETQMTAERLLQLVIQRVCDETGRDHKQSVLLVLLIVFEAQQPELWSTVKHYVVGDGGTLDLSHRHMSPVELNAMTFVLQKSDITSLNLKGCDIPAKEMVALATGIETMTALTVLDLSWNDVSPAAAKRLAESLESLTRLETLDLILCHIQDSGAREIVAAVNNSKSLKNLHFGGNHITADVCGELKEQLKGIEGLDVALYEQHSPSNEKGCARVGCVAW